MHRHFSTAMNLAGISKDDGLRLEQKILSANILIIDDEPANIKLLQKIMNAEGYRNIISTTDPREVEALSEKTRFDAILLDIRMPYIDGYGVMEILKDHFENDYLPIMVLTAQTDLNTRVKALQEGAKDFLTKPFDRLEALTRIRNLLEIRMLYNQVRQQNETLEQQVRIRTEELYETRYEVIQRLGLAAEYRDNETGNHIIRMSKNAHLLALAYGLSEHRAELILNAAPMHDIGKIGIPDRVLLKPGKLDPEEWAIMQTHVAIGVKILSGHDSDLITTARLITQHHHEKWDGSGYPEGLKGEAISIEGRICALADVFDALTSERPYKKAWTIEAAMQFMEEQSGRHFDPRLVKIFRQILPEVVKIHVQYADKPFIGQTAEERIQA